jgi:hypothetical protein
VFFARKKLGAATRHLVSLHPAPPDPALLDGDPSAQAQLVSHALEHLEAVQQLVRRLDEVPGGDRQGLLSELATAADGLRQLYFLDAIY